MTIMDNEPTTALATFPQRKLKRKPGRKPDVLTPKEREFINAYVSNGWNATRAAETAKYSAPGVTGSQLLKKPRIAALVEARLKQSHLSGDKLLARLAEMVNCNIADFCDKNGEVDWKLVRAKGHLVKSRKLKRTTDGEGNVVANCELELHDPMVAIDKLLRVQGAYKESAPQVQVNATGPVQFVVKLGEEELP